MTKHMTRFHSKLGMAPQAEVAMNNRVASSSALRRPKRSPSRPHTTEPTNVRYRRMF